jgi:pimeloyl-ACP methyl ester carboxylesterase
MKTLEKETTRSLIKLKHGHVHYEMAGPENGEWIVMVPGFLGPMFVWDHNFNYFANAGYRVLRFDLYGRGYSAKPRISYNAQLYANQIKELTEKLEINSPFNLIGLSMGGAISSIFSSQNPERIKKLLLVSSFGLPLKRELKVKLANAPVISDMVFAVFGKGILKRNSGRAFHEKDNIDPFMAQFRPQLKNDFRGLRKSVRSTYKNVIMNDFRPVFETLDNHPFPIEMVWGELDKILPLEYGKQISQLLPNVPFHLVQDCGHMPNYEKPKEFNSIALNFLNH